MMPQQQSLSENIGRLAIEKISAELIAAEVYSLIFVN